MKSIMTYQSQVFFHVLWNNVFRMNFALHSSCSGYRMRVYVRDKSEKLKRYFFYVPGEAKPLHLSERLPVSLYKPQLLSTGIILLKQEAIPTSFFRRCCCPSGRRAIADE